MSFFDRFLRLTRSARPVPKPQRLKPAKTVAAYRLPGHWLDQAEMDRVIIHWTAGSHVASSLDREHYHFLVEGDGTVVRGHLPVRANARGTRLVEGKYAAHTRACNTGSIGVSVCAMAGAVEAPFNPGKYPLTEVQFDRLCEVVAHLCKHYRIPVTPQTVLTHAEVQPTLKIAQRGKWDLTRLAFAPIFKGHREVGDEIRDRVREALRKLA